MAEVAAVGSGAGFPIAEQGRSDGAFPFLKVSDMNLPGNARTIESWNNTVTEEVRARLRAIAFPAGSVIFPKIGAAIGTNKKRLLTRPCCVDNNVMAVVPDLDHLESYYLYYLLLTKNLSDFASDSNPPSIRKTIVEAWRIPVPPLDEQRRIIDLLSRADGIVGLRREAQRKAAEIIPALFLDMFGDPARNPKGWHETTLGDVIAGADYGSSTKATDDGPGLPMIRMGNVDYEGRIDLSALKYVQLADNEIPRFRLKKGDLLFNRTNSKELVGKTGLWEGAIDAIAASYFIRVRVDEKNVRPFYVWAFMNSWHMKRVLFETARGAIGQANINTRELRAFRIPIPPIDVQDQFEERCRSLQGITRQHASAAGIAAGAFNSLLSQVFFSGERRLAEQLAPDQVAAAQPA